jgi:hypothetical protein
MEMYNEDEVNIIEETVHADFICNNCDTPGAHKISGTAGHSHDIHPCLYCRCVQLDANQPQGYDETGMYISIKSLFVCGIYIYFQHSFLETITTCSNRSFTQGMSPLVGRMTS